MVPAKLIAKYAFDAAKVAQQKKKAPLSKLLPVNATEKQFEKELNEAFAQVSSSMLSMRCGYKSIYQPCGHILCRKWAFTITPSENWSNLDTPEATLHSEFCCYKRQSRSSGKPISHDAAAEENADRSCDLH